MVTYKLLHSYKVLYKKEKVGLAHQGVQILMMDRLYILLCSSNELSDFHKMRAYFSSYRGIQLSLLNGVKIFH